MPYPTRRIHQVRTGVPPSRGVNNIGESAVLVAGRRRAEKMTFAS